MRAINEALVRARPLSLSAAEVGEPLPAAPSQREPIPVTAWVRFPESPVQIEGMAVDWRDRAVQVEFEMMDGRTFKVWVWASAVERRPGQM